MGMEHSPVFYYPTPSTKTEIHDLWVPIKDQVCINIDLKHISSNDYHDRNEETSTDSMFHIEQKKKNC